MPQFFQDVIARLTDPVSALLYGALIIAIITVWRWNKNLIHQLQQKAERNRIEITINMREAIVDGMVSHDYGRAMRLAYIELRSLLSGVLAATEYQVPPSLLVLDERVSRQSSEYHRYQQDRIIRMKQKVADAERLLERHPHAPSQNGS